MVDGYDLDRGHRHDDDDDDDHLHGGGGNGLLLLLIFNQADLSLLNNWKLNSHFN